MGAQRASNPASAATQASFLPLWEGMGRKTRERPDGHAEPASPASTIPLIDTDVDNVSN